LTDYYPSPAPETAADLRSTKRELSIGWIKGYAGIPGNEAADVEAKTGATKVDLAHPCEYVTAAWARGEGSRSCAGRLLTWESADIRG